MVERENFRKHDLDIVLEANRKAIEIETEVAEQNEEIIGILTQLKHVQEDHDTKLDKLLTQAETQNRDLFRIQVLFITGLLSLVIQIIRIFARKS